MYTHKWSANDPKAAIVLVHGTGEHHGRYEHVAKYLNERGWDVYTGDLPGCGRSEGKRGHIASFQEYVDTVRQWTLNACADAQGRPVFLMGHSLGGLIVTRFVQSDETSDKLSGVILTSPCLQLQLEVPAWKAQLAQALNRFWPTLTIPNGITPDMVSRDVNIQLCYRTDPYNYHKVSVRWYQELHHAMDQAWANRDKLDVPMLVLQAGDDFLVNAKAVEQFVDGVRGEITFRNYAGLRHEILNEPEREEILNQMEEWMNQKLNRNMTY